MNSLKTGKSRAETTLRLQVRDLKRERVRGEATKLFYERGFQGCSIGAIAERLNVTKPFIYSYFDNKHALLVALYERAISDLNAGVDKIFSVDHTPDERIKLLVKFYVCQNIESRELTAIFLNEERNLGPEILAEIPEEHREFDRKLTDLIRRGVNIGVFHAEDAGLASLSISRMVRWVHRWYDPDGRLNTDEICQALANSALNMVCYKPASTAPIVGKAPAKPERKSRPTADLRWATPESAGRTLPGAVPPEGLVAWGAALHAALLAGAMSRSFELALQYANDRSQFGRSMGKFQAVQHQLALMAEHVAAARMAAASAFAFGRTVPVLLNAAIAKARTNEAVIEVAAIAHAIHGAISVTRNMTSNSSPAASMPGVWPTVRKTIGTVSSVNGSLAQQVLRRCTCLPNTRRQARDDDVGRHSSMRRLAMGSVRTPTSVKSRYVRDRE